MSKFAVGDEVSFGNPPTIGKVLASGLRIKGLNGTFITVLTTEESYDSTVNVAEFDVTLRKIDPWEHVAIDTPVIITYWNKTSFFRHYAGFHNGSPRVFEDGRSSWSYLGVDNIFGNNPRTPYTIRLATDDEIKNRHDAIIFKSAVKALELRDKQAAGKNL